MSVKQRLKDYLHERGVSERAFGKKIGVSGSYVNSIRTSIQPAKLKLIGDAYPDLNPIWLLTGEGEMLQKGGGSQVFGENNTSVAGNGNKVTHNDVAALLELQKGYQEMIRKKDEQIERLIGIIEGLSGK
jgi:transcriptional regulator with XRE-family HTH domain